MSNPLDRFVTQQQPTGNPLDKFVSTPPASTATVPPIDESQPDLSTAVGRQQADIQNTQQNIAKLKAITPANADQAARIQRQIATLEASLPHGPLGMVRGSGSGSILKDVHGGLIAGLGQGLMAGADLVAKGVDAVTGLAGVKPLKPLEDRIAEASQTLNEEFNPEGGGVAGAFGNVAGNIIGGAPGYGAGAELTGMKIAEMAPRSLIGRAVIQASKPGASYITRAIANMASGSAVNALAAVGTEGEDPSKAATPEEAADIRNKNWQAKLAQFAIGIAGDAVFAAIPHGRGNGDTGAKEVPVLQGDLPPERTAQLADAKAKSDARAAAAKARKITQQQVQAAWVQDNPGELWSDLSKADKAAATAKYKPASDPNLDTSGNPDVSALQEQIAALNQKLSASEVDRRTANRLAETDHQLNIGNQRALANARPRIDNDPNMVWIMADGNGMKSINDNLGYDTGSQFLQDVRDHMVQATHDQGIPAEIFRYGGDEFLLGVPKDKAEAVHNSIENFAKDYSSPDGTNVQRGTVSGAIFNTLDDALSQEGKAAIASRKLIAKAVHNIPGRDAEEQGLIDQIKVQMGKTGDTGEVPATGSGAGAPAAESGGVSPEASSPALAPELPDGSELPPEVEQMFKNIHDAGGARTPEEMDALISEVSTLRSKGLPQDQYMAQLKDIEEDFTPFNPVEHEILQTHESMSDNPKAAKDWLDEQRAAGVPDEESLAEMKRQAATQQPPAAQTEVSQKFDSAVKKVMDLTGMDEMTARRKMTPLLAAERLRGTSEAEISSRLDAELADLENIKQGDVAKVQEVLAGLESKAVSTTRQTTDVQVSRINWSPEAWHAKYGDHLAKLSDAELRDALTHLEANRSNHVAGSVGEELTHRDILNVRNELEGRQRATAVRRGGPDETEVERKIGRSNDVDYLNSELQKHEELLDAGLLPEDAHEARQIVSAIQKRLNELKTPGDGSGAPGAQPGDVSPRGSTESLGTQGASGASDTPPPVSSVTKLETVKGKALEELNEKQLTKLEDHLIGQLQKAQEGSVKYESLQSDLDKVMAAQQRMGDAEAFKASQPALPEGVKMATQAPSDYGGTGVAPESQAKMMEEAIKLPGPAVLAEPLRSMSTEKLQNHIGMLESILGKDPSQVKLRTRLDRALEERALRAKGSTGVVARMPPGVGGAALGFTYGYMSDPNDPDQVTNALEWGLVGAVAGTVAGRMLARAELKPEAAVNPNDLPGGAWQSEMRKYVVGSDPHPQKPVPFLERMRNIYTSIIRRSYVMERWQQSVGGNNLTGSKNAAKLFANFGRWMGNSEAAMKYGPVIMDEFGTIKKLNAPSVLSIINMVKGDTQSLGELMAARAKVELGDRVKTPFDQMTAEMTFNSMPEVFHQAADAARQFSLAMADVLVDGGVLSQEARDLFANESMYAALQRVFKFDTGQELSAEGTGKAIAKAVNPLKARKGGSEDLVKNPFEVMVQTIPQFYRAAELNKVKVAMVEAWEAAENPSWLMSRTSSSEVAGTAEHELMIKQLQQEMKISVNDAQALVAGLSPSAIDPLKGTMRVFRNGVLESYKIPKEIAVAMQTLQPDELGVLTKMLGAPARMASKGITMNPYFVGKMALYDMWQATLNSQYGFRFGIDNVRGFITAARESQAYKDWISSGGTHQTLYNAGRRTISGHIEDAKLSLGTPLEVAVRNLKELKPIEAYKALIGPFADAARVGEYLRAKDHGASDLEAVFASKQVTANYSEIGSAPAMKALQHMTMFLGPAIQVLDQATYRAGIHPFRTPEEGRLGAAAAYATKAFMTIALPSWYIWHANKDDKEINQLRQTQTGRKYWFIRSSVDAPGIKKGDIVKIPKPPVDGQVFGTSIESMLDSQYGMDAGQTGAVSTAIAKDAMFNILPTAGVIPYSLQANQDLSTGRTIIPGGDEDLALQYQGEQNASWIARSVSRVVAPHFQDSGSPMVKNAVTPAGIDYLINSVTGMLGQDLAKGVSQAVDEEQKGYVPAKEEYPIIGKLFAQYPTFNVRSVQNFYARAARVQSVGATINHLAATDQKQVIPYVEANKTDVALIDAYAQARQTIANARRTITDIKNAPQNVMDQATRQRFINMQLQQVIDYTTQIEKFTAQVDKQYKK